MGRLRITQIRGTSRRLERHARTLRALGLRRNRQSVVQSDTAQIRGMVESVRHLVVVEEVR
jgi:large subunit ribosomal protein L30